MRALIFNQLWFIVPVNPWKFHVSSELFTNFSRVLPTFHVVYQPIDHRNLWCITLINHKNLWSIALVNRVGQESLRGLRDSEENAWFVNHCKDFFGRV